MEISVLECNYCSKRYTEKYPIKMHGENIMIEINNNVISRLQLAKQRSVSNGQRLMYHIGNSCIPGFWRSITQLDVYK